MFYCIVFSQVQFTTSFKWFKWSKHCNSRLQLYILLPHLFCISNFINGVTIHFYSINRQKTSSFSARMWSTYICTIIISLFLPPDHQCYLNIEEVSPIPWDGAAVMWCSFPDPSHQEPLGLKPQDYYVEIHLRKQNNIATINTTFNSLLVQ